MTLAALAIFLVFSVLTLPAQNATLKEYDQGLGSPDTSFIYNSGTINAMAEAYGETGRSAFVHARWTFDLAFPFVYTFFLLTSVSLVFKRAKISQTRWGWLNLAALGGFVFDLAENTAASVVMSSFPIKTDWAASLAPIFTPIKWIFIGITFLLLLFGMGRWLFYGVRHHNSVG